MDQSVGSLQRQMHVTLSAVTVTIYNAVQYEVIVPIVINTLLLYLTCQLHTLSLEK